MSDLAKNNSRVLIVAHTTTFLTELALFGRLLRERGDADVIYYCAFAHWTADEFAKTCAAEGVFCLLEPIEETLAHLSSGQLRRNGIVVPQQKAGGRIVRLLIWGVTKSPSIASSFIAENSAFDKRASQIDRLLSSVGPALLVLGGDMPGYDTSLFVQRSHAKGVPVMIVPSTMSNGLEQAEVYYGDPSYHVQGYIGNLLAAMFPKWVRQHKGKRLFRCPPGRLLAMEFIGIAPPEPWIFNSGFADAIAMESEAMIDYYAKAGMKHDRMILTGSLSDDLMASQLRRATTLRRELCSQLKLDPEKLLFLTALPPDFLYVTGGRPQCDFQSYRDLVEFWVDALAELTNCNCIVALHPSVDVELMRWIERPNVQISTWKTAGIVPLCDVYVASISSTIRWAIACGKPVVNYDVYRYRYTDFLDVSGVLATEEQDEYTAILHRLANDPTYRAEIAGAQRGMSSRWGLLDGHVGDRMLDLVKRLSGIDRGGEARTGDPI